jgi:hypothetical protein
VEGLKDWLPEGGPAPGTVFDNHILRSKVNYQFTRELSLRVIFDYNAVLANQSMLDQKTTKRIVKDVLLTYMVHPGTALYIGYSDARENLLFDPSLTPALQRTRHPTALAGQQVFVKLSYLLGY